MADSLPQIYWNRNSLPQSSVEGWLHTIGSSLTNPSRSAQHCWLSQPQGL